MELELALSKRGLEACDELAAEDTSNRVFEIGGSGPGSIEAGATPLALAKFW